MVLRYWVKSTKRHLDAPRGWMCFSRSAHTFLTSVGYLNGYLRARGPPTGAPFLDTILASPKLSTSVPVPKNTICHVP
jgi:hypothetical protein